MKFIAAIVNIPFSFCWYNPQGHRSALIAVLTCRCKDKTVFIRHTRSCIWLCVVGSLQLVNGRHYSARESSSCSLVWHVALWLVLFTCLALCKRAGFEITQGRDEGSWVVSMEKWEQNTPSTGRQLQQFAKLLIILMCAEEACKCKWIWKCTELYKQTYLVIRRTHAG